MIIYKLFDENEEEIETITTKVFLDIPKLFHENDKLHKIRITDNVTQHELSVIRDDIYLKTIMEM
jgi:hypothetical protein